MANTKITNPELFNLGDSTSATQLPVMTTTQRTAMTGLSIGEMIFNSTTDKVEYFDGTKWYGITYEVTAETPYNNVLYTGNGSASGQAITGVGFDPDLVWMKRRNTASDHTIVDSVRGANSRIFPNETDSALTNGVFSFLTDGFNTNSVATQNQSGSTYVAWCFKAGGAPVANPDGTLASQVSANVNGGFSIVTGSAPSNGYTNTFGHGLGQQPDIIITKLTNVASDWIVIFPKMSNGLLKLNTTGTFTYDSLFAGTSTTLKTGYTTAAFDFVAYCFASVPGYSKIGTYTGTGAGTTVPTGFQPAFVMIKKTSGSADWIIFNDKTGSNILKPNLSNGEVSITNYITYNLTSFTFPTSDSNINIGDFIFMSFA